MVVPRRIIRRLSFGTNQNRLTMGFCVASDCSGAATEVLPSQRTLVIDCGTEPTCPRSSHSFCDRWVTLGLDRDLDDAFPAIAKKTVSFGDLLQRKCVRQERCQVETPVAHQLHEPSHPLFPTWAQCRDDLVIAKSGGKGLQRDGEFSRVNAQT